MKVIDTKFNGLKVIEPSIFQDDRGYFYESFQQNKYSESVTELPFIQDNEAYSSYGTIRGLHFQKGSSAQGKLVRVLEGEILDVVVDLRKTEPTFGQVFKIILNDITKKQLYVPPGFAHGYSVLSDTVYFLYKCTQYYDPASEGGIHPLDKQLNIDWLIPKEKAILSQKDKELPPFSATASNFS